MFITRFLTRWYQNHKYQKILNKIYKDDEIISKISTIFGVQFYKDWVGRLYAVVNPAIKDGQWDPQQIFEYTSQGYDTTEHATQWIMERMVLLENFIQVNNLFDLLGYDIQKIDDSGNYLFTIYPITLPPMLSDLKKVPWEILIIGALTLTGFLIF